MIQKLVTMVLFVVSIQIANAETILINQPNGDQNICMIYGTVIQCY